MRADLPTLDEARANRSELLVEWTDGEVSVSRDGRRMFTEDELAAAQASEGELIRRALTADLEKLRAEQREGNQKYLALDAEADRLRRRVRDLERERAELHATDGLWDRHHKLAAKVDDLTKDNARLARELRDSEQSAATFKTQAYEQNDRAAELKARMDRLSSDYQTNVKALGDAHQRELEALRATIGRLEKAVETKDRTIADMGREAKSSIGNVRADFQRKDHQIRTLEIALMEARLAAKPETMERIGQAVRALFTESVDQALGLVPMGPVATTMKHAVESARDALSPFAPQDTTSQA